MSGKLVQTNAGQGHTNNDDRPINGKIMVYLDNGNKILCSLAKVAIIGFWDGRGKQLTETK